MHLNEDGKIDQLIGYMRPIPVAQKFRNWSVDDFSLRDRRRERQRDAIVILTKPVR